ncbi:tripartite tricarboxylate transporter substrate-binding protein [Cupriavidus pauculus]|uniref:tripartite tricarboxylate transporter substrate-binding protein n=1 Tax=Cupriavidus pauculus TaxID=82633 RepID=UPI003857ED81
MLSSIYRVKVKDPARLPSLPDVPTFSEAGQANVELEIWHGFYAPKGTPTAVIERLNHALRFALADPAVLQRFGQMRLRFRPQNGKMRRRSARVPWQNSPVGHRSSRRQASTQSSAARAGQGLLVYSESGASTSTPVRSRRMRESTKYPPPST